MAPYTYSWNTGPSTASIDVGAGTHIVTMTDSTGCVSVKDTVVVTAFASAIEASAGIDTVICASSGMIQLYGSVQAASGGHWVTGLGTFSPDSTGLNATYTLSASEITNGSVELVLVTTGNGSCPADSDSVTVTVKPNPTPVIGGPDTACADRSTNHSVTLINTHTYAWSALGGTIVGRSDTNFVEVLWGSAGTGSVTITETDTLGCDSTVTLSVDVRNTPIPVIIGPDTSCEFRSTVYSISAPPGNTFQWSASGGTISGSSTAAIATVIWGPTGAGSVSVTQTNSSNCDSTVSLNVDIKGTPTPVIMGPDSVCEYRTSTYSVTDVAGDTYQWIITGGTVVGSDLLDSVVIDWGTAGIGLVSIIQTTISGCDSNVFKFIDINATPTPTISGPDTVCEYQSSTHTATAGDSYLWSVSGGTIIGDSTTDTVNVSWGATGTGIITLTQTNASGCDSVMLDTITIQPTPVPVITSGLDTVCEYSSNSYVATNVVGDTYQWVVTGGNIIGTSTSNTVHVSWGATGSAGIVSLTQTNSEGCDSTVSDTIVILPTPVPLFIGDDSVCAYTTTPISVVSTPGYIYQWTVNGGVIIGPDTTGDIFVKWGSDGVGSVVITLTNSDGCDSTDILPIVIHPTPAPVIAGLDSVCELRVQTYSVTSISGSTYQWTATGGTIISSDTSSTISVSWGPTGQGILSVTQTSDFNCDSSVTDTINIHPTPRPNIFGSIEACEHSNFNYHTLGAVGYSYQWSAIGGAIVGSNTKDTIEVRWGPNGPGSLTLTTTNDKGCDSTVSVNVDIKPTPVPVIFGPDSVCEFNTAGYQVTFVPGDRYKWIVDRGSIIGLDTLETVLIKWDSAGIGTLTLTQINIFDCDSTASFQTIIKDKPVPVISGPSVTCEFRSNNYSVTPVAGNTYQWTVTGGTIQGSATADNITVDWGFASFRTVTVTQTNSLNCDSTISLPVNVTRTPTPVIFGSDSVCSLRSYSYATPQIGSDKYKWTVTGGGILGPDSNNTVTVLWGSTGVGTIMITETTANGCDSSRSRNINIHPGPVPGIEGPRIACEFRTVSYKPDGPIGDKYQWTVNGGTILNSDTSFLINVRWGAEGTGILTLKHINSFGCDSTRTTNVDIQLTPKPRITGPIIGCELAGVSTYNTTPVSNTTYNWSVQNGTITGGLGTPTINVRWDLRGAQQVTLTQINKSTECDSTVTFNVTVDSVPQAIIQSASLNGCVPFNIDFTGNSTNPNITYSWDFDNGDVSNDPNPSTTYNQADGYNVVVIATHPSGCADTATNLISVFPIPDARFETFFSGDILFTTDTLNFINQSADADVFSWNFGDGNISTLQDPITSYENPGVYRIWLVASNPSGCLDSTSRLQEVRFRESIIGPTAFSPNGDGTNDIFSVESENMVKFNIVVFNRWGEIVFSSDDPNFVWDGTNQGTGAPKTFVEQGMYGYLIKAEGFHGEPFEVKNSLFIFY